MVFEAGGKADFTNQTWMSLIGLLDWSEFFITVDHFTIWRRHLAWSKQKGSDLRGLITQRFASNMVFMSLMLSTELMVFFNSSHGTSEMRVLMREHKYSDLRFWIGVTIFLSVFLTLFTLFTTFTAWGMVSTVSDCNAHCILRSSIGQYVTQLPHRLIVCAIYSFLLWILMWLFYFLPGLWSQILVLPVLALFFHIVWVYSAFGRLIIHTGAMGNERIFDEEFEQALLPSGLHTSLLIKALGQQKKRMSVVVLYRPQDQMHYSTSALTSTSTIKKNAAITKTMRVHNKQPHRNQDATITATDIHTTQQSKSPTPKAANQRKPSLSTSSVATNESLIIRQNVKAFYASSTDDDDDDDNDDVVVVVDNDADGSLDTLESAEVEEAVKNVVATTMQTMISNQQQQQQQHEDDVLKEAEDVPDEKTSLLKTSQPQAAAAGAGVMNLSMEEVMDTSVEQVLKPDTSKEQEEQEATAATVIAKEEEEAGLLTPGTTTTTAQVVDQDTIVEMIATSETPTKTTHTTTTNNDDDDDDDEFDIMTTEAQMPTPSKAPDTPPLKYSVDSASKRVSFSFDNNNNNTPTSFTVTGVGALLPPSPLTPIVETMITKKQPPPPPLDHRLMAPASLNNHGTVTNNINNNNEEEEEETKKKKNKKKKRRFFRRGGNKARNQQRRRQPSINKGWVDEQEARSMYNRPLAASPEDDNDEEIYEHEEEWHDVGRGTRLPRPSMLNKANHTLRSVRRVVNLAEGSVSGGVGGSGVGSFFDSAFQDYQPPLPPDDEEDEDEEEEEEDEEEESMNVNLTAPNLHNDHHVSTMMMMEHDIENPEEKQSLLHNKDGHSIKTYSSHE